MHLSTHNWMRAEPLEATLKRISRLGYASIEISGEPTQYETKEVRGLLRTYGIRCWGGVTLTLGKRNLAAKDVKQRADTVQYAKDVLTMIHELEGEIISVVPATVGKILPDASPEEEWQWLVEGCKEIYDFAKPLGIRVGIEPLNRFETYIINRTDQALALADAVAPDCGVCLDVFHMNIEDADIYAAIAQAGKRIVDFHIADNNRMAPGQGAFDWPRIVGALEAAGYDGAHGSYACEPLSECRRPEPGRHSARAAEVHPGPRVERPHRGVLLDAGRQDGRNHPSPRQVEAAQVAAAALALCLKCSNG
jgi:sugar phosphate isomerase/epimerase